MEQFRVTKYDPRFRKRSGAYDRDEWTSVSDIGSCFGNVTLTASEYVSTENAYVEAALFFLEESGVAQLEIAGFENHTQYSTSALSFKDGYLCSQLEIAELVRLNLREVIWCRLEARDAFLHFGYDYYMYVGVPNPSTAACERTERRGLFVEPFESPYRKTTSG